MEGQREALRTAHEAERAALQRSLYLGARQHAEQMATMRAAFEREQAEAAAARNAAEEAALALRAVRDSGATSSMEYTSAMTAATAQMEVWRVKSEEAERRGQALARDVATMQGQLRGIRRYVFTPCERGKVLVARLEAAEADVASALSALVPTKVS